MLALRWAQAIGAKQKIVSVSNSSRFIQIVLPFSPERSGVQTLARKTNGFFKRMHGSARPDESTAERLHTKDLIDSPATARRAAVTTLRIGMQGLLIVHRDLFARRDIAEREEQHVSIESAHVG